MGRLLLGHNGSFERLKGQSLTVSKDPDEWGCLLPKLKFLSSTLGLGRPEAVELMLLSSQISPLALDQIHSVLSQVAGQEILSGLKWFSIHFPVTPIWLVTPTEKETPAPIIVPDPTMGWMIPIKTIIEIATDFAKRQGLSEKQVAINFHFLGEIEKSYLQDLYYRRSGKAVTLRQIYLDLAYAQLKAIVNLRNALGSHVQITVENEPIWDHHTDCLHLIDVSYQDIFERINAWFGGNHSNIGGLLDVQHFEMTNRYFQFHPQSPVDITFPNMELVRQDAFGLSLENIPKGQIVYVHLAELVDSPDFAHEGPKLGTGIIDWPKTMQILHQWANGLDCDIPCIIELQHGHTQEGWTDSLESEQFLRSLLTP